MGTRTAGPGLLDETGNARELWEMCRDEADFDVDPGSIVAWGVTSGADIYCWVTTNEEPDRWPVLTYVRYTDEMQLHPPGMAEFLRRLLDDTAFRQRKISVVLQDEVSFVNWRKRWQPSDDSADGVEPNQLGTSVGPGVKLTLRSRRGPFEERRGHGKMRGMTIRKAHAS